MTRWATGTNSVQETDNSVRGDFSLSETSCESTTVDQTDKTSTSTTANHDTSAGTSTTTVSGNDFTGADTSNTTSNTCDTGAASGSASLTAIAGQLAAAVLGAVDYAGPFWKSLKERMSKILENSGDWQVHRIYQQGKNEALASFLKPFKVVNGKTGDACNVNLEVGCLLRV